jgi:hypothetical protein
MADLRALERTVLPEVDNENEVIGFVGAQVRR